MYDIDMPINNAQITGSVLRDRLQTDAGMQWLIEHGPVAEQPPLAPWVLRQLVATQRIHRLRRGAYLAPDRDGVMPHPAVAAALLAPEGYLSFYGALTLHGLTDQSAAVWAVVSAMRQRPARYGELRIEFVPWPRRLDDADTRRQKVSGVMIRVATPTQAFCDMLEAPRFAPPVAEMLGVLRTGLATKRLDAADLRRYATRLQSSYLAARLGFLLETASGKVDPTLLALARQSHAWRDLATTPGEVNDSTWRIRAPASKEQLIRSST